MPTTFNLKQIEFGYAEAEKEAATNRTLLLRGFLDPFDVVRKILKDREFLILGYKGSGKSAIAAHLRLIAQRRPDLFVTILNIADISPQSLRALLTTDVEPQAVYPTAWSWLLLLYLLNSFAQDNGSTYSSELRAAFDVLRKLGLSPTYSPLKLVETSKEYRIELSTALGGITVTTTASHQDIPFLADRLKILVKHYRSRSKHVLIIDGLDQVLRGSSPQYDVLGGLIYEVNRLNMPLLSG